MRPGAPAGGSGRIGRNLPFKGNKIENKLSFLSRKIRFVYKEGGRDGATAGKGGGVPPLFIPAGAGERLFLFPLRPRTLWPTCRPRLFLPCRHHRVAIGHPVLFLCIGGGRVAARHASRCGDVGRPFAPFLPAQTASLSLASMGCGGTARPLFSVLIGGRADFPSSPRSGGTERPLRLSSRRWSREAAPPLLAAAGRRDRSASPRGGGAERPFRLSSRRWSRAAVPPLLAAVGQRDRSASPRSGGTEGPLRFSSQRWGREAAPPLLAAVGQRGRSASPRGGGAKRPFCLSSRQRDRMPSLFSYIDRTELSPPFFSLYGGKAGVWSTASPHIRGQGSALFPRVQNKDLTLTPPHQ